MKRTDNKTYIHHANSFILLIYEPVFNCNYNHLLNNIYVSFISETSVD